MRKGVPSTSMGCVASSGPTIKATMYVDIDMVSAKRTAVRPEDADWRLTSAPLEIAK